MITLAAAWLLLAVELGQVYDAYPILAHNAKTTNIVDEALDSAHLRNSIALYGMGLLLVYGLLGCLAWISGSLSHATLRTTVQRASLVWLVALYATAFVLNAASYPNSLFAAGVHDIVVAERTGGMTLAFAIPGVALLLWSLAVLPGAASWLCRAAPAIGTKARISALAIAALVAVIVLSGSYDRSPAPPVGDRPNVVLIGIDSLRCDVTALGTSGSLTPRLDQFLAGAHVFTDTVTPLARTFPAWVSLLTGQHPVTTNARVNLTARELINAGETLPDRLRKYGYTTVLATDEVRFSNIDETYGFDKLIAPPIGAADFILGTFNDLTLSNLLANTRLGSWLFPHTFANRAAYKTYDPHTLVDRLEREFVSTSPIFLAVHLTLPHWPYAWKDLRYDGSISEFRRKYPKSVHAADEQFSDIMNVLHRKGLLENAIVVVFSDHGEAVGNASDSMVPLKGAFQRWSWNSMWGHGTSVLNPHQYRVLLAARSFGNSLVPDGGRHVSSPASLEDVAPTIADLLNLPESGPEDGISLVPLFDESESSTHPGSGRIRFTESEFNPPALREAQVDANRLAAEASSMYEVRSDGRLQLRADARARIIGAKELAAMRGNTLLAALPMADGRRIFLWMDGGHPYPINLGADPDVSRHPEAAELLIALRERFPGET